MAISGKQTINVGVQNQPTGSDSLYLAFSKTEQNFTTLFSCASPYTTFSGSYGLGVSSGGTADPNYILFPVALEDPLTTPDYPWRLYNDTTAVPVDGTGGTAAITLVRNTTTPLNPLGDFEVAKAGVSAQGSGFSTDFTIDRRHLGRVLPVVVILIADVSFDADKLKLDPLVDTVTNSYEFLLKFVQFVPSYLIY